VIARILALLAALADEAVSVEFSGDGPAQASLSSGKWDVQKLSLKFVPGDDKQPSAHNDFEIAAKFGLAVRVRTFADIPEKHLSSESSRELIAIKP
jgi:hypothetical protein